MTHDKSHNPLSWALPFLKRSAPLAGEDRPTHNDPALATVSNARQEDVSELERLEQDREMLLWALHQMGFNGREWLKDANIDHDPMHQGPALRGLKLEIDQEKLGASSLSERGKIWANDYLRRYLIPAKHTESTAASE